VAGVLGFRLRTRQYASGILFGAAAGNLARGVPLASDGTFCMAFFTEFTHAATWGLLDWYTVSVPSSLLSRAAHGATLPHSENGSPVHDRSAGYTRVLWGGCAAAFGHLRRIVVGAPNLLRHAIHNPYWWLGLLVWPQ